MKKLSSSFFDLSSYSLYEGEIDVSRGSFNADACIRNICSVAAEPYKQKITV